MHPFLSFLIRTAVTIPSVILIWLISYLAINNPFWLSSAIALVGGALIYGLTSFYTNSRFLKKNALSRKEYRYIKKNLNEAKPKIARLQKSLFSIRHLPSLKERMEIVRIIRKIYTLTKKEPKRFYLAERFYFSHLDSILELTEKYAFLSSQPKRNRELEHSLYETRETLSDMGKLVEGDLYRMIEEDLDDLNFEIDVAKYSIKSVRDAKNELFRAGKGKSSSNQQPISEEKRNKDWRSRSEGTENSVDQQSESTSPKYFINTKIAEKEEIKLTRESKYKDKKWRFPE